MAVTIFRVEKKSDQTLFFKKFIAPLTIAPTENLHEYKIVERKMSYLFYMGKLYLALLVSLYKAHKVAITIFEERKISEQTLFFKKFIAP